MRLAENLARIGHPPLAKARGGVSSLLGSYSSSAYSRRLRRSVFAWIVYIFSIKELRMSELECRTSDGCEAILLAERNEATEIIWALRPSSFIATPPAVSPKLGCANTVEGGSALKQLGREKPFGPASRLLQKTIRSAYCINRVRRDFAPLVLTYKYTSFDVTFSLLSMLSVSRFRS